ncbi:MAG: D-alanyl-D-alanine carboxypeptidase DacB precursor, partial [Pseudomonadota bacterium]
MILRAARNPWLKLVHALGLAALTIAGGPVAATPASERWDSSSASARASADLPPGVLKTLRQAQVPASALSVVIAPLPARSKATGETPVRLAHQADTSVNPASVMKLFTTYAGLSLLGPEHLWRTRVYADGPVRDGVLQGNLIVRGSGDPKLVVERLQDLLTQVQAAGV